jgi:hypothetical protein
VGDFRARDADRDRYVDVIEAAYVDGQLGEADRELRVSRALVAETLGELDGLTRDLQNRPAPAVPRTTAPVASPSAASASAAAHSVALRVVGVAAAIIVGMGVLAVFAAAPAPEALSGDSVAVPREVAAPAGWDDFTMDAASVREFVRSYAARFGSFEPHEVTFFPRRVVVLVPLPGPSPRLEVWAWDGEWTKEADRAALDDPHERVDLRELDARRLADNVRTARGALGVEQGRFGRAVLSRSGDDPAVVTIRITNQLDETGTMTTTPGGEIVGRQPYRR